MTKLSSVFIQLVYCVHKILLLVNCHNIIPNSDRIGKYSSQVTSCQKVSFCVMMTTKVSEYIFKKRLSNPPLQIYLKSLWFSSTHCNVNVSDWVQSYDLHSGCIRQVAFWSRGAVDTTTVKCIAVAVTSVF